MSLIIATVVGLLPIINPFSTAPIFIGITEGDSAQERQEQAHKAVLYMVYILLAFLIGGTFIMQFFGLSLPGIRIAGGILIVGIGMQMLYPSDKAGQSKAERLESKRKNDISLTPLAIPILAGPGAISITIGLASIANTWLDFAQIIIGIIIVAAIIYATLLLSTPMVKLLGVTGLNALTRIMGFLILCIGVQFVVNGVIGIASSPELINGILQAIENKT